MSNGINDDPFVHLDAAYVLGALEPAERAEFEAHLLTCPECAARVEELQPIPAMLAGLPESAFSDLDSDLAAGESGAGLPDTLLPGLLRRAARQRNRRHWVTAGLGALAAACLLALVVVVWPTSSPSRPAEQAMVAVVASPVRATATLDSVQWGTKIHLECYYAQGVTLPTGYAYDLAVIDKNNVRHDLGSWRLNPGKETDFSTGTSLTRSQISKVQIELNGQPILQLST